MFPAEETCFSCSASRTDPAQDRCSVVVQWTTETDRQHAPRPGRPDGPERDTWTGGVRASGRRCSLPRGSGKPSEGSEEVVLIGAFTRD